MRRIALLLGALALTLSAALATIAPSAAIAAATPTNTAVAATGVTTTTATLNGTVNLAGGSLDGTTAGLDTGGADTTGCYFEYGTTTSYGSYLSCKPTPTNAGTTAVAVAGALSSLTSGTTYHYRVVTQVGSLPLGGLLGTTTEYDSADATFTTPSPTVLPAVATTAASNVGGSSAIINGTVNPQNYPVSSCTFTYGPSGGATSTTPCTSLPAAGASAAAVSAPLIGLTEGTAYTYSLSVVYGSGTTATASSTSSSSFTTTAAAVSAPQAVTATSAALSGSVNPEGQSVTSCTFYYGTSASNLTSVPCTQAASSISGTSAVNVSATVTGLSQKTNYIDTVVLVTAQGQAVATAGSYTTLATPTGTTAAATNVTATTATLRGTVNAGGEGVTACAFEWGVNPLTSSSSPGSDLALVEQCAATPAASGNQSVTVTLKGLAPNTKYYYRVLLSTYGGYVIANTVSFTTPKSTSTAKPTLRITATKLNTKARSAKFSFARTGSVVATKGFECSLATVTRGKAGAARYSTCKSARTYTKLKAKTTYVFSVRAGNTHGYGTAVSHRFTI